MFFLVKAVNTNNKKKYNFELFLLSKSADKETEWIH